MLRKKRIRTFKRYKAQFISMVIMICLGIGVFTGFNMEWYSLLKDTGYILEETGFADYRIYSENGFSKEELEKVKAIGDVTDATRFSTVNTSVKGDTDVVAIAVTENPSVSGVYLMEGEPYDETSSDGIWLSDQYADKNGIGIGDELTLTYKTLTVKGTVRGLVKSGEFMICLPDETQLMPDYNSYGFAYISPVKLEATIPAMFRKMVGNKLYSQINVLTDLPREEFVKAADEALGKTTLVLSKDENISWSEAMGEVNEGKTMGAILPVLFLAIAMLTMVTTMHRITASEKTQIGTLKALGFKDRQILRHYTSYACVIALAGTIPGMLVGYLLGWYIMNPSGAMGTYIDMPRWNLYMPPVCWGILILMNLAIILIGYFSAKKMLSGTPAEALRPYTPKNTGHLALEETKAFKKLNFGTKWNLRDCFRHKARTGMTLFGMIGCMVLLVGGLGMNDTLNAFIRSFYEDAIHYENRINLDAENMTMEKADELTQTYEGDWSASKSVQVGDKAVSLEIYHITNDLVRFVDSSMDYAILPEDGCYICKRIADEFGLKAGDEISFSPYGTDSIYTAAISGIIRSMSESIVMSDVYAGSLEIDYVPDTIYTNRQDIESDGMILNVQTKKAIMDSFDTFTNLMIVMVSLLVISAVILSLVVLYNLGVMSYTERYREMATLKVVGFKDRKIAGLLVGQNLWLTAAGVLIGLPAGAFTLKFLIDALAGEYEMRMEIGPVTYLVSILLTFTVSLLVGWMVARKNRHIDMVAALKTEE